MALILRSVKGSALTYAEMDGNLTYLESSSSVSTLADTLVEGNITDGNDMTITTGDTLDVNGTLDLSDATVTGLTVNKSLSDVMTIGNITSDDLIMNGSNKIKSTGNELLIKSHVVTSLQDNIIETEDATTTTIQEYTNVDSRSVVQVEANITAIKEDFVTGLGAKLIGHFIVNSSGTVTQIGTTDSIINSGFSTADVTLSVVSNEITVQVTGEASTVIVWNSSIIVNK
jgi:hypothetical protein